MTVSAHRLRRNNGGLYGQDRSTWNEPWRISGLVAFAPSRFTSMVVPLLPQIGDSHPDAGLAAKGAQVRGYNLRSHTRLLDGTYTALVDVQYDSGRSFGGGARRFSRSTGSQEYMSRMPVWQAIGPGTDATLHYAPMPRNKVTRVFTVYKSGAVNSSVLASIVRQGGCLYTFDDLVPYVFIGVTTDELPSNQTRFQYTFETRTPTQAISAGSDIGNVVDIPALDWLEDFVEAPELSTASLPVTVNVISELDWRPQGDPITYLPEAIPVDVT